MFNFLEKPWGRDPELSIVQCGDDLRETLRQIRADVDGLADWAQALAEIAETRAAEIGCAPEDYLRGVEWTGPAARAETSQLERDAKIAASVERESVAAGTRLTAHRISRCALHLAHQHSLRIGLGKVHPGDDGYDRLQIVHDTSLELSLKLYALAHAHPGAEMQAVRQNLLDWLDAVSPHV